MTRTAPDALVRAAVSILGETAQDADTIGYLPHVLVMCTMPHARPTAIEHVRRNGRYTLSMTAPAHIGLPYGVLARLMMSWIATEAVRTRSREIYLGHSLSSYMRQLGMSATGGAEGSISRLRDHMRRIAGCTITITCRDQSHDAIVTMPMIDDAVLWWEDQPGPSRFVLGDRYYHHLIDRPVPVDIRALQALRLSPLAMDIYCWLTYRMSYVRRPVVISWPALQAQFGAEYGRPRDFRKKFLDQLKAVSVVYPEARLDSQEQGILLRPSKPHISKV